MDFAKADLIRVFAFDPELLHGVDDRAAAHLRTRTVAPRIWVHPGPWRTAPAGDDARDHLGMLVIEGLLVRTFNLAGREGAEVIGPGDLIRPWMSDEFASVESHSEWRALQPAILASLDARFAAEISRWPAVTAALLARSTRRSRSLAYQSTIAHVRHAETRVLLALWHLADRWGRVTSHGVEVPVPLTHQLLAQLTCLQRPTVSLAVSHLTEAGEVARLADGGWLLKGGLPSAPAQAPDLVAT
jgi:CRP-like cAMP-binding protein